MNKKEILNTMIDYFSNVELIYKNNEFDLNEDWKTFSKEEPLSIQNQEITFTCLIDELNNICISEFYFLTPNNIKVFSAEGSDVLGNTNNTFNLLQLFSKDGINLQTPTLTLAQAEKVEHICTISQLKEMNQALKKPTMK